MACCAQEQHEKAFKKKFLAGSLRKIPKYGNYIVSFINTLYIRENCSLWDYVKDRVGKSSTVE